MLTCWFYSDLGVLQQTKWLLMDRTLHVWSSLGLSGTPDLTPSPSLPLSVIELLPFWSKFPPEILSGCWRALIASNIWRSHPGCYCINSIFHELKLESGANRQKKKKKKGSNSVVCWSWLQKGNAFSDRKRMIHTQFLAVVQTTRLPSDYNP